MKAAIKLSFIIIFLMVASFSNVFCQEKKHHDADVATQSEAKLIQKLQRANIPEYSWQILNTYPHDTSSFTEGLTFQDGFLYESTGLYGHSRLRKLDKNMNVINEIKLTPNYFGEGMTLLNDNIYQLTYQEHAGFVYDKNTFASKNHFSYAGEGWGLTNDGKQLVMSNGSALLTWLDPINLKAQHQIQVKAGNTPIPSVNELEYIDNLIYANVWPTSIIIIITPQGSIKGWFNIKALKPAKACMDCVANGIAYDEQDKVIYVTGKNWPTLYAIKLLQTP